MPYCAMTDKRTVPGTVRLQTNVLSQAQYVCLTLHNKAFTAVYSICIPLYSTLWSPKKFVTLFFISQWFLQTLTNLYSIWHTVYGVNLQYLIYPPHLNTAASLPWGNLI